MPPWRGHGEGDRMDKELLRQIISALGEYSNSHNWSKDENGNCLWQGLDRKPWISAKEILDEIIASGAVQLNNSNIVQLNLFDEVNNE